MDVNDIFRQLTCGAKLIKNKFKNNKNVHVKREVRIFNRRPFICDIFRKMFIIL